MSERERLDQAVELIEAVLKNDSIDPQARSDLEQARAYAAGARHILRIGDDQ